MYKVRSRDAEWNIAHRQDVLDYTSTAFTVCSRQK